MQIFKVVIFLPRFYKNFHLFKDLQFGALEVRKKAVYQSYILFNKYHIYLLMNLFKTLSPVAVVWS